MSPESNPVVVRPRVPLLAAAAAAVAVASIVAAFFAHSALVLVAVVSAAWAGQQLLDRGRVLRIVFHRSGDMVLASAQEELHLGGADIGGIGSSGSVVAGRLSMPFGPHEPLHVGRVVVVDQRGDVLAALRSGWMPLDELQAGARWSGHRWAGHLDLGGMTFGSPSSDATADPRARTALDDGTSVSLELMGRQTRAALSLWTLSLLVGWVGVVLMSNAGVPDAVMDPLRLAVGLGVAGWIGLVGTQRLRSRPVRRARRVLADAQWESADVVVLRGAPADPGVRAVVCLDAHTGRPVDSWLVEPSVTSRWLQEYQRRICHLARSGDGRTAVLASGDREHLALVVKRIGLGKSPEIHDWAKGQLTEQWRATPRT